MHHASVTVTASAVFHTLLFYCGFCIACANAAQPPQQSLALAFENTSCADALKRAASEQKYLLVLFSGEWVEEEAQVKDTVLQDKQVARATAGRVIAVRADAVRDTELMQQFQIRALPTMLLLNASGDELARWTGVPKAGALAKDLSAVLDSDLPLAKINAPGEAGSYRKNFNAAVELQKTGAYEAALKQYQLAYEKLNSSRGKVSIAIINAEEVVWLVAAMRKVLPEADAMLRDYLEKYRARIAKDPNAEQAANCAFEIYRAIAGRDAALSLYQQTPPGKVREMLKWDAFAIFAHKQDYAQAVALTTPDEALMLVKGKADAPMLRLRKAIYGYFEVRNNPRLGRVRSDRHLVVVDEFAKTLIFEAYAGADDERTSREVALVILGKKPKPEHISLLHAALRRAPWRRCAVRAKNRPASRPSRSFHSFRTCARIQTATGG